MNIHQILNNNIISTIDAEGQEFIAMGRGLAFSKKKGDQINIKDVEKFFVRMGDKERISGVGDVIKEYRHLKRMTREKLSAGICSENELYLIEINKKNPPIHLLNALGDKLGFDLFAYYEYFNYKNNKPVLEHRENITRYIKANDIEKLREEIEVASQLEEFQKEPLIYDIKIHNYAYEVFINGEIEKTTEELSALLKNKQLNIDPITLLDAYIILSSAYQIEGQWDEASRVVGIISEMIKNKMEFPRYNTVIISALISITSFLSQTEQYEELIKFSKSLKDFQEKHSEYNRIYYVEFYFSFAYYKAQKITKSKEHFVKGLYAALYLENKVDIAFITQMEEFKEVSENLAIDQNLINELYEILESPDY